MLLDQISRILTIILFSTSLFVNAQQDCNVDVTFTWVLDSDWCESYCKVWDSNGQYAAGYFSACQNLGCSICTIEDLHAWVGVIEIEPYGSSFIITQSISLPEGEYTFILHDGYGDGWADGINQGENAFSINGNIQYSIDFDYGFNTTGEFVLSCDPTLDGCTDITACNYNSNAINNDGSCLYFDVCGICDGDGIPEGYCDCLENTEDAIGDCGGDCLVDSDNDGVCDDCPGETDECGVCNGWGAVYQCGCFDIPEGYCDCNGNQLDALDICGGDCISDIDNNGICDDIEVYGCTDVEACNYSPSANIDDETCDFCSCSSNGAGSDYTLTVECHPTSLLPGFHIYRFYVNMVNPTDRLTEVRGYQSSPLIINVPSGIYNSQFNQSWSASGLNPAFIGVYPEISDDSYATIGLSSPAVYTPEINDFDPSLIEGTNLIETFFTTNGADELISNEGAWYLSAPYSNGLADEQGRVLIMQLTTQGGLSGTLNYVIKPLDHPNTEIDVTIGFNGPGTFGVNDNTICGCMEPTAINYNPEAQYDNGSCVIVDDCGVCNGPGSVYECGCSDIPEGECDCDGNVFDALGDCGGTCQADIDNNGVCDDDDVNGCTDQTNPGYNPDATVDDGSCLVGGCVLTYTCNYDSSADYLLISMCDFSSCFGCMDENACNFDEEATLDNFLCEYPISNFVNCEGVCFIDIDADGICDQEDECVGSLDECGVCNGPGEIYECGCSDIPEGQCGCN